MILKAYLEKSYSETFEIDLVGSNTPAINENFFSILIGENGASKSMILSALANYLRLGKDRISASNDINVIKIDCLNPEITKRSERKIGRIIAVSISPFDRFYPKSSFRGIQFGKWTDSRPEYFYLGMKGRNHIGMRRVKDRVYEAVLSCVTGMNSEQQRFALGDCFKRLGFDFNLKIRWSFSSEHGKKAITEIELSSLDKLLALSESIVLDGSEIYQISLDMAKELDIGFNSIIHDVRQLEKRGVIEFSGIFVRKTSNNVHFDVLGASSGEVAQLIYCMDLASHLQDYAKVFIDEPEISLHPNWQIDFVEILKGMSSFFKGCHFIIATHSPYILSGLPKDNSHVVILRKNSEGQLSSESHPYSTSGWSVEKILLDVFGVQTVRNSYFEREIRSLLYAIADSSYPDRKSVISKSVRRIERFRLDSSDPLLAVLKDAREILKND